jgi:hypothetical protein
MEMVLWSLMFLSSKQRDLESLVRLIRSICVALAAFLFLLGAEASAGDYKVTYAIDAGDKNDAGTIEKCEYTKFCRIESEKLKISILLSFGQPDHNDVDIHIYGNRGWSSCCYFADGVDSVVRDARGSLIRLRVFEGRRRLRNEFLQNAPVGVLYLRFSDLK